MFGEYRARPRQPGFLVPWRTARRTTCLFPDIYLEWQIVKDSPVNMDFLRGFAPFLDYRYWFNPRPVPLGPSLFGGILAFFGWFLIVAVALWLMARGLRKEDPLRAGMLRRFARLLAWTGSIGLLLLLFAYEQLPLLGMRFWVLFLFIMFVIWLCRIITYIVRDYPLSRAQVTERQRLEKYLPVPARNK